jgi:lipopolysaccharide heptosyltransferase II
MIRKILIVNVNWIGDVLFSTPFIRSVRQAYPDAHIACLLHPRCKEMLESNPRLNEIIIYDEEGSHRGIIGKAILVNQLRRKGFDTAFLLHRSFTKAFLTFLAGIRQRIGYATKNRSVILTKEVDEPDGQVHKVEYFLNIARAVGINPTDLSYEFFVDDDDKKSVNAILLREGIADKDRIIVLCPGGNWDPKRWPKENFAGLGDLLAAKTGARIIISGAKKDAALAEDIKGMMKTGPVITAGKTTLRQLGALLSRASLVIANDSGPMHMAVAMKAKTIALFGPTSAPLTGPYGKGRYRVIVGKASTDGNSCEVPCYDLACNNNRCMSEISVADVLSAAMEMLNQ